MNIPLPPLCLFMSLSSCYSKHMNKQIVRIITGIGIIAIGIAALLSALNIVNFTDFFKDYWPMIVVLAGLLMLLANPRQFVWPLIVIVWGGLSQLQELNIIMELTTTGIDYGY